MLFVNGHSMGARIQNNKKVNNKGKALSRQQHVVSIKEKKEKVKMKKKKWWQMEFPYPPMPRGVAPWKVTLSAKF